MVVCAVSIHNLAFCEDEFKRSYAYATDQDLNLQPPHQNLHNPKPRMGHPKLMIDTISSAMFGGTAQLFDIIEG